MKETTKFIKIYEKTTKRDGTVELYPVVSTELTEEEFKDLRDYFSEFTPLNAIYGFKETYTFHMFNRNERLEDAPLPDGTIIHKSEFSDGEHFIVFGDVCSISDFYVVINIWD